jgi:uncharacterized DUF497 family protein
MSDLRFSWDPQKSRANERKHGVSFDEAQTVFLDDNALFMEDPEHSEDEDRFLMLGVSSRLRLLVVCHCLRESGDVIRLISARKATKPERTQYKGRLRR